MSGTFLRALSYPRAVVMAALYPLFLGVASLICIAVNLLFNRRGYDDFILRSWGRISCRMFGVHVRVHGLQNVPAGGGVFVFNHSSFFDIFAMAGYIPSMRFGAKIELFHIPIFGRAMRRIGILPIARGRREEVFRIYKEAEARLHSGERIALAPEGTRQLSEDELGAFKSGPFVFAISAQVPVIPVVIKNASRILPKKAWFPNLGTWHREIDLKILEPVGTQSLTMQDRPQLQKQVQGRMQVYFTKLQAEVPI